MMRWHGARLRAALLLSLASVMFFASVAWLGEKPRQTVSEEMQVVLPRSIQLVMAGGDRYLAANFSALRVVVASPTLSPGQYEVQAKVQTDIAWLNPAHEDNYYVAAALLPWNGQLDAGQEILKEAIDARPFDWLPIFYYAFNLYHFQGEAEQAGHWLQRGAERAAIEQERLTLQALGVKWIEKGSDLRLAANVVRAMAEQSHSSGFKKYLNQRVERLLMLQSLRDAAKEYQAKRGSPLRSLDDLLAGGILKSLPADPFNVGFGVDAQGLPVFKSDLKVKK